MILILVGVVAFGLFGLASTSCNCASKLTTDSKSTGAAEEGSGAGREDEAGSKERVAEREKVLDGVTRA